MRARKIAIIPTLCTLGNAASGFTAIVFLAGMNVGKNANVEAAYVAGWLIFVAMLFDALDGYLARLSKTASNFGAELDSLCDAISFGAAPGFLLLFLGQVFEGHRLATHFFLTTALLYLVCAILRLARFNVQTTLEAKSHRSFRGLPSPAAAGCVASLALVRYGFIDRWLPESLTNPAIHWFAPLGTLLVALLMVSRVPYPHLVNQLLHRRRNFGRMVELVVAVFAVVLFREFALFLMFWGYAAAGPVRLLWTRFIRHEAVPLVGEPPPSLRP